MTRLTFKETVLRTDVMHDLAGLLGAHASDLTLEIRDCEVEGCSAREFMAAWGVRLVWEGNEVWIWRGAADRSHGQGVNEL